MTYQQAKAQQDFILDYPDDDMECSGIRRSNKNSVVFSNSSKWDDGSVLSEEDLSATDWVLVIP